jgi:S1-C subfamily serine protease
MKNFRPYIFVFGLLIVFAVLTITPGRVASGSVISDWWSGVRSRWNSADQQSSTTPLKKPVSLYQPAQEYEKAVIAAVKKASPAVVSIVISKDVPYYESCPQQAFPDLPPEFQQFFGPGFTINGNCQKGTKKQDIGGGSGFVVTPGGMIVTNKHVVADENADYTVFTSDGKKYPAKVLSRSKIQDVAIIKIEASRLPVVDLADSDSVELGQTAIAIGNALAEFRNTVSVGVISGKARTITASSGNGSGSETIRGLLQTDAAINPGNSGGPLLNLAGEVVGINTAIATNAENIGFAIPINQVKKEISAASNGKVLEYAYLGVRNITLTEDFAKKQGINATSGALLRGDADGPADKAGLKAEDIVLLVDGIVINSDNTLPDIISRYSPGDVVTLHILRDGKEMDVRVTLEKRP